MLSYTSMIAFNRGADPIQEPSEVGFIGPSRSSYIDPSTRMSNALSKVVRDGRISGFHSDNHGKFLSL